MQTNNISTRAVLELALERSKTRKPISMIDDLVLLTGVNAHVALRALEREVEAGYLEYATSLNYPWLTNAGSNWLAMEKVAA